MLDSVMILTRVMVGVYVECPVVHLECEEFREKAEVIASRGAVRGCDTTLDESVMTNCPDTR